MIVSANLIKSASEGVRMSRPLAKMVAELPDGKYRVTIESQWERHSVCQRRLLFMWFSYLNRITGQPKQSIYEYYAEKYLTEDCRHVSQMTSCQLSQFMHEIEADAASELGVMLPTPEDASYQDFIREYKDK